MFRPFVTLGLIALMTPGFADTITGAARIDSVTIYPGVANVTRQVTLDLPAGRHAVIVPDLPVGLSPEGLRVTAPTGVQVGAVNLATDRLPVTPDQTTPAVQAARDRVAQLEDVLRAKDAAIAEMRLVVQVADEQIAFLQSLSQGNTDIALDTDDIRAMAQMVGAELLSIRQTAFAAEQDARAAERARQADAAALKEAEQALAALIAPAGAGSVLTFTLDIPQANDIRIDITTLEGFANWQPVYDMRLTTGDDVSLAIDRAVVISQDTGQDWTDVALVLSTARPGEQVAPSDLWPLLRRIAPEDSIAQDQVLRRDSQFAQSGVAADVAALESLPAVDFSGAAITYTYPTRVDIRNGVDDLRLPLDTVDLVADVRAEAVPARDTRAYRVATFTNTTDELLLPGRALLFADGTMIGFSALPLLAAGADTEMGFGPVDGLRLSRVTPGRSEGETGVFSSANQLTEEALITVENLTAQDWRLRLRDAIPYSEQDDLEVRFTALPDVTRRNPDGQRGILEWDLEIAAGARQQITLDYTLTWPNGYVLQ